jgi:hypothetical protein
MSKISKIEFLKSILENYTMKDDAILSFETDIQLGNGNMADFQIKKDNQSIAIGKFIENKISLGKRDKSYYFRSHPFIRGGYGNCWFFFDGVNFVFHNVWMDVPGDNFTSNFNDIIDASIEYLNERI